jgi:hypothetical protein
MSDENFTWERSHEWEVHRTHHNRVAISVVLTGGRLIQELVAVRRIWEAYRAMPPSKIQEHIVGDRLPLGVFSSIAARRFREAAAANGLRLQVEDWSTVSYLPFDKTTNMACLIEDDREAEEIAKQMIASGVPVIDAEDD